MNTTKQNMEIVPGPQEFHLSIRVADLAESSVFYERFLGVAPKQQTARFSTFIAPHLCLNLVLLVNDRGETLDTYSLYHLGLGVRDRAAVIESYHRACAAGAEVVKPPRTTWRGTPLHELWLRDPTGYNLEIYARLTAAELAEMPTDMEPWYLVPETAPESSQIQPCG
ncbi:VOC family protein [Acidithiobacillus sp.]|uniref:VOC family protein n=1 Tax=Acidithiobacillus sp. TaxID=1872118 RepID=UPI002627FA00|nr:VOC family protein [Acidithiobacillus sp.]